MIEASGESTPSFVISGPITSFTHQALSEFLSTNSGSDVELSIYSLGGELVPALAMHAELSSHDGKVVSNIVGFVGSAATVITSACDTVRMPAGSMFMVHNSTIGASQRGAQGARQAANIMDTADSAMMAIYRQKTGRSRAKLMSLMDGQDHYLSAKQAKDFGFVDEITTPSRTEAAAITQLVALCTNPQVTASEPDSPEADALNGETMAENKTELNAMTASVELLQARLEEQSVSLAAKSAELESLVVRDATLTKLETELSASGDGVLGAIQGLKANSEKLEAVTAELAELKAKAESEAKESLIQAAVQAEKLTAAQVDWARTQSTETLEGFLATVQGSVLPTVKASEPKVEAKTVDSDKVKAMAELLGFSEDEVREQMAMPLPRPVAGSNEKDNS